MTVTEKFEATPENYQPRVRATWDWHLARWLSNIFNPPVLAAGIMGWASTLSAAARPWLWIYLGIAIFLPVAFVGGLMRRGRVSSADLTRREERFWPYGATLVCMTTSWGVLNWGGAPSLMSAAAGASVVQLCVLSVVTLRWKISLHGAAIAAGVTFAWLAAGHSTAPLFLLVPLIAWARVRLRRHTWLQTAAGALVGSGSMWLALQFVH